jgi:thiol-disulfide isomerase/thioredoxin
VAGILAACGAPDDAPGASLRVVDLAALELELAAGSAPGTLVNVWATWCPPCLAEMPDLARVAREHASAGLRVLLLNIDGPTSRTAPSAAKVLAFARELGIDLPILYFDGQLDELAAELELPGPIPHTLAVDAGGLVRDRQTGAVGIERLRALARAALGD